MGNKQSSQTNLNNQEEQQKINPEIWYRYEKGKGWIENKSKAQNNGEKEIELDELKIQNQNIWFNHRTDERFPKILEILQQKNAHFICLQEVQAPFLKLVSENSFFQENYLFSDTEIRQTKKNI